MTENHALASGSWLQYFYFAIVSIFAVASTAVLAVSNRAYFQPYFGHLDPLFVMVVVAVLGFACMAFLQSRGWFEVFVKGKCVEGFLFSAMLASLFGVVVILVDVCVGFPENINVPLPQSLLFYPAIAYVVEVVFHALPLVILFTGLWPFVKNQNQAKRNHFIWYCIFFVAVLEPVFHMSVALSGPSFSGLDVFVGLQVFLINFFQLVIFRRYGFISMLSFRLVYYLIWHIAWGHLRLELIF